MKQVLRSVPYPFFMGFLLIAPMIVLVVAGDLGIVDYKDPLTTGYTKGLTPPSESFPMGTDQLGRDIFSWTVFSAKTAFVVAIGSISLSFVIALLVGLAAGYFGGIIDNVLMRITDFFLSIPRFILILFLVTLFSPTLFNITLIIGLFSWQPLARIVRAEVLSIKEREYVLTAKVVGSSSADLLFNEILPNALPPIIVASALQMSQAIITESALSFLGLGDPNIPSWGKMLELARRAIFSGGWWMLAYPSIFITISVLGINLIADGLNDILNPKLKKE